MANLHPQQCKDIATLLDALNSLEDNSENPKPGHGWGSGNRAHVSPAHVVTDFGHHLGYLEDNNGKWTFNPSDEKEGN